MISSTDSKVRTTLYSIINSTTGKYCSVAFIWMVTIRFQPQTQKSEPPRAASWHLLHLSTFQSVVQKLSFQWLHFRKLSILLLVWNPQCLLSSYKGKPLSIMSLFLLITGWNWVLWRLVGVQWGLHRDKLQHRRGSFNKDLKRFTLPLASSVTVRGVQFPENVICDCFRNLVRGKFIVSYNEEFFSHFPKS